MARHRLSLTDATYLHTTLLTAQLSWFDLLLVASSTPDFPALNGTTARDEKRPVLTMPTTVASTLLQRSDSRTTHALADDPGASPDECLVRAGGLLSNTRLAVGKDRCSRSSG